MKTKQNRNCKLGRKLGVEISIDIISPLSERQKLRCGDIGFYVDFVAGNRCWKFKLAKIGFGRKKSVEASMCLTLEVNGTDFNSTHEMIEVTLCTISKPAPLQLSPNLKN